METMNRRSQGGGQSPEMRHLKEVSLSVGSAPLSSPSFSGFRVGGKEG